MGGCIGGLEEWDKWDGVCVSLYRSGYYVSSIWSCNTTLTSVVDDYIYLTFSRDIVPKTSLSQTIVWMNDT